MKLLISTATLILSASVAMAAEATTRVAVEGLTCPSCSYIVATAMKDWAIERGGKRRNP